MSLPQIIRVVEAHSNNVPELPRGYKPTQTGSHDSTSVHLSSWVHGGSNKVEFQCGSGAPRELSQKMCSPLPKLYSSAELRGPLPKLFSSAEDCTFFGRVLEN